MLDITFYSNEKEQPRYIAVAKDFLLWLAKSDFIEIGSDRIVEIKIDGESAQLPLVKLGQGKISNRQRFRDFFLEIIRQESDRILTRLGDSPTKEEYQIVTYRLKKLLEILRCIEDEKYLYLQRI